MFIDSINFVKLSKFFFNFRLAFVSLCPHQVDNIDSQHHQRHQVQRNNANIEELKLKRTFLNK